MSRTDLFLRTPFARAMRDVPLRCLDIGSRGGIDPDLLPVAFAVDATGFEPDTAECDRLAHAVTGPWRSVRFIPAAMADGRGTRTLHVAANPVSSSLLRPNPAAAERFGKTGYGTIVETRAVEAWGLDEAVAEFAIPPPDYIKLDVEGMELDILRAGEAALAGALAVKAEVAFLPLRREQPAAREVDAHLTTRGFELIDLIEPARWRRHGHVIHPMVARQAVPYSRGQLAHGDLLYMRRPDTLAGGGPERRLRAAWLAMAYGHFDRAEEYLADADIDGLIRGRWDIDPADALRRASLVAGRAAWRAALYRRVRGMAPCLRNAAAALLQR